MPSLQALTPFPGVIVLLMAMCLLTFTSSSVTAEESEDVLRRGAQLYKSLCLDCHGAQGEGTPDNYPNGLFGDRPTVELAEVIATTMPEGEPEACQGEDAAAVAAWMQSAFYSPEAQARLHPPSRQLSRLTVSQYRNAVADLYESFHWYAQPKEERGLTARYYKSRNFRHRDMVTERVDPVVNFDFGEGTPDSEKIPENEQFSIRWEGSLIITESGWYDFIVKTENGARLYVNDRDEPLIDAWVKSGYDTEYRERRYLLAGRIYPLNLEWFTYKEETASIRLFWKPPHGVEEAIPARHLTPEGSPASLIVETPFPPDDRSDGYIRGTSVSPEWYAATTYAAMEAVDRMMPQIPQLSKLNRKANAEERRRKSREFCETFAYRAFRRPLNDQQRQTYIDHHFSDGTSTDDAVRRSLLSILKSPWFLYHNVSGTDDSFAKAERLAFALLDSIPHPGLLKAAEKGWLNSDDSYRDQARKLLETFRGQTRLREFLRVWLNLERLEELNKDSERYPQFTPELVADLRTSLELLLDECVSEKDGFARLMTTRDVWMNRRVAEFYDVDLETDSEFAKVAFQPDSRAGVISHPFMLAGLAYHDESSPIHRGVFLSRSLLGRALKPPPDSVAPVAPELEPDLTTRQRTAKQTSPAMCANCHRMINSLGFALEEFDAVGRMRTMEKGKPVDASGLYRQRTGETTEFRGAPALADFLLKSRETHRSFCRQLFHHMVQQPILAYGPNTIDQLADKFAEHQFQFQPLMVEIAMIAALAPDTNLQTAQKTEP